MKNKLESYYRSKIRKNGSLLEMNNYVVNKLNKSISFKIAEFLIGNSYSLKELSLVKKNFK